MRMIAEEETTKELIAILEESYRDVAGHPTLHEELQLAVDAKLKTRIQYWSNDLSTRWTYPLEGHIEKVKHYLEIYEVLFSMNMPIAPAR
jgi:hypothetical protein